MDAFVEYAKALLPPVAIGFIFYRILRSILEADRRERRAVAQWEAEEGRRLTSSEPATHEARTDREPDEE